MIDRRDHRIIALLRENARLTYEQLGEAVGLSAAATFQRVRKLEEAGVITGYHASVDPSRLGLQITALLRITPPDIPTQDLDSMLRSSQELVDCYGLTDGTYLTTYRLTGLDRLWELVADLRRLGADVSTDIAATTIRTGLATSPRP